MLSSSNTSRRLQEGVRLALVARGDASRELAAAPSHHEDKLMGQRSKMNLGPSTYHHSFGHSDDLLPERPGSPAGADDEAEDKRIMKDPGQPTKKEWEEHRIDIWPFRSWCPHCLRGRATCK